MVPALIANAKDASVDAIGLNVGRDPRDGRLAGSRRLESAGPSRSGSSRRSRMPWHGDAVRASLTHASPGVRRIAIALLPKTKRRSTRCSPATC